MYKMYFILTSLKFEGTFYMIIAGLTLFSAHQQIILKSIKHWKNIKKHQLNFYL